MVVEIFKNMRIFETGLFDVAKKMGGGGERAKAISEATCDIAILFRYQDSLLMRFALSYFLLAQ